MLRWITNWAASIERTPQKQAERVLNQLRLELFHAEQRVMDAQMHAEYYRARLTFFEEVMRKGIEQVSDERRNQTASSHEVYIAATRPPCQGEQSTRPALVTQVAEPHHGLSQTEA